MDPSFWNAVTAIAAVISLVVVVYGASVALRQLKELTRTRHLEAMLSVYELIGSDQARDSRRFLYSQLRSSPGDADDNEWMHVDRVAALFDRIGSLAKANLIPVDELLDSHSDVLIRSWAVVEPYAHHRRRLTGANHVRNFEWLAELARMRRAQIEGGAELKIVRSFRVSGGASRSAPAHTGSIEHSDPDVQ